MLLKINLISKKRKKERNLPTLLCFRKWLTAKKHLYPYDLNSETQESPLFLPMPGPATEPTCSHSLFHKLLAELLAPVDQSGQNTHLLAHSIPHNPVYMLSPSCDKKPFLLDVWCQSILHIAVIFSNKISPYPNLNLFFYFTEGTTQILVNRLSYNNTGPPSHYLTKLLPECDNEERPAVDRARGRECPGLCPDFVGVFLTT